MALSQGWSPPAAGSKLSPPMTTQGIYGLAAQRKAERPVPFNYAGASPKSHKAGGNPPTVTNAPGAVAKASVSGAGVADDQVSPSVTIRPVSLTEEEDVVHCRPSSVACCLCALACHFGSRPPLLFLPTLHPNWTGAPSANQNYTHGSAAGHLPLAAFLPFGKGGPRRPGSGPLTLNGNPPPDGVGACPPFRNRRVWGDYCERVY